MTAAPQLAVGTTLQGIDDTSFSPFQLINAPLAPTLVCGNIFAGLQGFVAVVIPLGEFGAGLCRGANILTDLINAGVTFTANGTWTAGGTILCNVMLDDSPRVGPLDSRLAWKPVEGSGPAWRRDFSGAFDVRLEDTGGTPFIDLGLATSFNWGIRAIAGHREELACQFTVPAGPGWSVARAIKELRRFGVPIGSMEVAIQTNTADAEGHPMPDGVDLGVSAAVLNSTIPLTPASGPITYAFAPDVVLAPGVYWSILRPSVPYPISVVNFVVWGQRRIFLNPNPGSHLTGASGTKDPLVPAGGVRLDQGNFPGHADVALDTQPKEVGTDIVWNPIARVAGQSVSTPDLSPLVQEVILTSGHETASAICFTFRTVGETRTYRFASHDHATLNPPGFAAQFRRRNIRPEAIA